MKKNKSIQLYPLSHPQKRIWYLQKIFPESSLNILGGVVNFKGTVDFSLLEKAILYFIESNDGVRFRLIEKDGDVFQYVHDFEKIKIDFYDFNIHRNPHADFQKWEIEQFRQIFKLEDNNLFYFALYKLDDQNSGYFVKFHHIIADGWSVNIMTDMIKNTYLRFLNEQEPENNARYSYIDFIEKENKYLASEKSVKNKAYWSGIFSSLPAALIKSADSISGERKTFYIDNQLAEQIKTFTRQIKCSLNSFFVAMMVIYLYRVVQQDDIVIGTPVLNRTGVKDKQTFGMFTSTMPFRINVKGEYSVSELVIKIHKDLIECYFNQKYPYDLLVKDLDLKKRGYDSLYQICVNYYNTRLEAECNGLKVENRELYSGEQAYALQMVIKEWSEDGSLTVFFDYKTADYTGAQISGMYECILNGMKNSIVNPQEKINRLGLMTEAEHSALVYGFNSTAAWYPADKTMHRLFEKQVEKTPDNIAVEWGSHRLTYRELNERANRIAGYLLEKGAGREFTAAIITKHSPETVAAVLGVLKAGGAYLPIDHTYPAARINYMLKDSSARIVLTNCPPDKELRFKGSIIDLNDPVFGSYGNENPGVPGNAHDLAYIIYTSGSTGKPKGVMIEHGGLVNYVWWAKGKYVKNRDAAFALYSSLSFDLTVTSIFVPLLCGGRIVVYSDDGDEFVLYKILADNKVNVIKLTPAHLRLLMDGQYGNSAVRSMIVGGEDLKTALAGGITANFGSHITVYNEYGPTETVVGCMIHEYNREKDTGTSVPIGIPAANVQIYILDQWLNTVPPGTAGEIYISGDGVARGYLNRQELTTECFVPNPFIPGRKMYKTGDLARHTARGLVEYLGRADNQVKIRGYRIELREIEKHLAAHEGIVDAVVIDREQEDGGKYLCAYFTGNREIGQTDLRAFLSGLLPDYMIPQYFIKIPRIPLTANGKIDRSQLPAPAVTGDAEITIMPVPCNPHEEKLVQVICEVLQIKQVGMNADFFHLGGDSIKAIQIASRLNNLNLKIRVNEILSYPVIGEMAARIRDVSGNMADRYAPCEGSFKPTPVMSWFLAQNFARRNHWHQSVCLELPVDFSPDALEYALSAVISQHDSLRINYDSKTGNFFYNAEYLSERIKVSSFDFSACRDEEQAAKLKAAADTLKSGMDIEKTILFKACVFDLGKNGKRLLLTAHHLVTDMVSWRIILEDLNALLSRETSSSRLPQKTDSFARWADALVKYGAEAALKERRYWETIIANAFTFLPDHDTGDDTLRSGDTSAVSLDDRITGKLLNSGFAYNTEVNELLIAALALAVSVFTGNSTVVIELEGHGREEMFDEIGISRTTGWFTSLFPVLLKTDKNDLSGHIALVKEQLRSIPNHGIGCGVLKYISGVLDYDGRKALRFNYLGNFGDILNGSSLKLTREQIGSEYGPDNHMTCLVDMQAVIIGNRLQVSAAYSRNKFRQDTISLFLNRFLEYLKDIIDHCTARSHTVYTPSDFDGVDISQDDLDVLMG